MSLIICFFSKIVDASVFLANGVRLCQNEWISIKSGLIKSPPPLALIHKTPR
jgi:hypothetical protein